MDLQNKVALVTGSAHRVGQAIALHLARAGASQVIHYGSSGEAAEQTAREVRALGVDAITVQADLRRPDSIETLFAAAAAHYGRLDVLVNSAASFTKQDFDAVTLDSWEDSMQTNLRAPFLCCQQAARLMRQTPRPIHEPALIVNITDLSGFFPWRGYVQHGVSKAGLIHLTHICARELGPDVRVNAIAPGPILPPAGMAENDPFWQNAGQRLPLRRTGSPEYVGQTVVFLAQNDYITGAVIPVDGGEHLLGPANH